jgi:hypothetical protein
MLPKCSPAAVLALLALALPAAAQPPASHSPLEAQRRAERSFSRFAADWVARQQQRLEDERTRPRLISGGESPMALYHAIGDDFSTELRATGQPAAPWVGVVNYTELVYSCTGADATSCALSASSPVSEIFRFRDGRWIY